MVIVNEGNTNIEAVGFDSGSLGDIFERSVLLVVQQQYTVSKTHNQVCCAIVVIVACRAPDAAQARIEPGRLRDILKLPVAEIVIKAETTLRPVIRDKDVHTPVPVVVQEAGTRTDNALFEVPLDRVAFHSRGPDGTGLGYDPRLLRHVHKPNRN